MIGSLSEKLAESLLAWRQGLAGSPRLQDGWQEFPFVRDLATHPKVLDLLRHLYGREPFPFQSLNFAAGSEQPLHSDAVHFHSYPNGFMCGVWAALEDVQPESGPLIYVPGSHRLPYISAATLGLSPEQVAAEAHPQIFFEPGWQAALEDHGWTTQTFLPSRGQALIWHANLLHGGAPVLDRNTSRWSQVTHFFFQDCLFTTPLHSFRHDQGGTFLRNPFDISRGDRHYSEKEWQAISHGRQHPIQQLIAAKKQESLAI
jgi:hypothetical protein